MMSTKPSSASAISLQWGRDQLIAEIALGARALGVTVQLQWGRDQLIAEIAYLLSYSIIKYLWKPTRAASRSTPRTTRLPSFAISKSVCSPRLHHSRALPAFPHATHRSRHHQRVVNTGYSPISPSSTRANSRD